MITLGSWPDWIAATFTSLAFVVAAFFYARSVRVRREAQARLVYSKFTHVEHHEVGASFDLLPSNAQIGNGSAGMTIVAPLARDEKAKGLALAPLIQTTVIVHNGSKELIGPARIQMVNTGRSLVWDDFSISVGTVEPESDYTVDFTWINTDHPGQPALGTSVIFRDASGQWWRRHLAEPIERVHDDPENSGPTAKERVGIRAYQRSIGINNADLIAEPESLYACAGTGSGVNAEASPHCRDQHSSISARSPAPIRCLGQSADTPDLLIPNAVPQVGAFAEASKGTTHARESSS